MSSGSRCTCHDTLVVKNLNRWFKEKWVDVSRKDPKTGKHPPCGRSKAKTSSKGYPKCRPSVKVSDKTPKTSRSMTTGQKRAATKRKRAKRQGVGGKPTIVKNDFPIDAGAEPERGINSEFDMIMALTDEAYRLAEMDMPYNHRDKINPFTGKQEPYDDYMDDLEVHGEDMLGRMMTMPKYENLRERYNQLINPSIETDANSAFSQQFAETYKSEPIDIAHQLLKEQTTLANHMGLTEEEFRRRAEAQGTVGNLYNMPSTDAITGEAVQPRKVPKLTTPTDPRDTTQTSLGQFDKMDLAFSLIKERKSPEAMRRKLEYDKRYEKTPERREYQRELHAERRKRGIYGSGDHMDVSHSQGGRLTLEPEHSNRARHFKDKGTLRRVAVR